MDLDPLISLAVSIQSHPGTYALLVGSGISRNAQIPTGWDVVVDLIRQVAVLSEAKEPADPIAWFREQQGAEPDYSLLLEGLAHTTADRRNLLNRYFEPTPEERERGVKVPTRAHRAIAELVAGGYIRVIVTTNFDRLLEAAIRDAGVEPIIISSPAAAAGAMPLAHSRCTIIKLHGDYLDPDLKNTVEELGAYDSEIDRLLDRICDEYGLLVCGWSGEWDEALRKAILRAPNRRYGMFWTRIEPLGARAAELVSHRAAVEVPITGADEFFEMLVSKVTTLAEMVNHHPLSTALAVAELKRYMPDPVHRIRLHDLVMGELKRALALPSIDANAYPTPETESKRMHEIESTSKTLLSLITTLAFYGDRQEHDSLLFNVIDHCAKRQRPIAVFDRWSDMELYPALLSLYAIGLGALAGHRLNPLLSALVTIKVPSNNDYEPLVAAVSSWRILGEETCNKLVHQGSGRRKTPISDYLHDLLREHLQEITSSSDEYSDLFDLLEYLLGVVCTPIMEGGPIGRFSWRRHPMGAFKPAAKFVELKDALLGVRLFDGDSGKLDEAQKAYEEFVKHRAIRW